MEPARIEGVGVSHAAVLASLHTRCFAPKEQWDTATMISLLGTVGCRVGLMQLGGHPVGFVMLRCVAGEAEILTLCVSPEYRRQGFAAQLVAWSLACAVAQKADMVFLEVSVANHAAQKLYAQAGFAQKGTRKAYYPDGSDALVLGCAVGLAA